MPAIDAFRKAIGEFTGIDFVEPNLCRPFTDVTFFATPFSLRE